MKKVIGIDLGTSNSAVAFKSTGVEVLRNRENEELTPSCVGLRGQDLVVGKLAMQLMARDPENTILSVKRLMGMAYKDEMVQKMIAETQRLRGYYKYAITPLEGATEEAVAVVLGGHQYAPEQISAEILKAIKADAEAKLGDEVTHAVITVPAYFTEKQKNATKVAAELAGLSVLKLLPEPTAAAIAYGVDNTAPGEAKTVLVYDFGGGTFDLSVLDIQDGQYSEVGTGGDRWLGGDDIDKALATYIYRKTSEASGVQVNDLDGLIEQLPKAQRFKFLSMFRERVESLKVSLSAAASADFILEDILEDKDGNPIDINLTVTRQEFEKLIRPLVQRSISLIDQLLRQLGRTPEQIDAIVLVGGTSCTPLVQQMLGSKYGADKMKVSDKPMLAIAEGAAILAHRMGDDYEAGQDGEVKEVLFRTNHDYFIKLDVSGQATHECFIRKQTPIPASATRTYRTTTEMQRVLCVEIENGVEGGRFERAAMGIYLLEEQVPINTEFVFDFKVGMDNNDELLQVTVHPKGEEEKTKEIILGRGKEDEKTIMDINNLIKRSIKDTKTINSEMIVQSLVASKIEEIERLGAHNMTTKEWQEISAEAEEAYGEIIAHDSSNIDTVDKMDAVRMAMAIFEDFEEVLPPREANVMLRLTNEIMENDKGPKDKAKEAELVSALQKVVYEDLAPFSSIIDMEDDILRVLSYPSSSIGDASKKQADMQRLRGVVADARQAALSKKFEKLYDCLIKGSNLLAPYEKMME